MACAQGSPNIGMGGQTGGAGTTATRTLTFGTGNSGNTGAGNSGNTGNTGAGNSGNTGAGNSGNSGNTGGAGQGGSVGQGCGLTSGDSVCDACMDAACCAEAAACANDATCIDCLTSTTPPSSCSSNASVLGFAGCLQQSCNAECLGGSSSSSSSSSSSGSTSSSGGTGALTCADVNNDIGCCDASGVVRYCLTTSTVHALTCTGGYVCGWNDVDGYYDCIAPPTSSDPSGQYPKACGGGSGSTSSSSSTSSSGTTSSSSSSSSSSSGGTAVTWTTLYNTVFGPSGSSSCVSGGGCHTSTQSGFKCGTSKSTCYTGMINAGLVTAGASASSSALVSSSQSPLCNVGSFGNMPKGGSCVTASQLAQIKSWLASGAPNN
jgi:hypothetical protein